jgi:hypothetical protein
MNQLKGHLHNQHDIHLLRQGKNQHLKYSYSCLMISFHFQHKDHVNLHVFIHHKISESMDNNLL